MTSPQPQHPDGPATVHTTDLLKNMRCLNCLLNGPSHLLNTPLLQMQIGKFPDSHGERRLLTISIYCFCSATFARRDVCVQSLQILYRCGVMGYMWGSYILYVRGEGRSRHRRSSWTGPSVRRLASGLETKPEMHPCHSTRHLHCDSGRRPAALV